MIGLSILHKIEDMYQGSITVGRKVGGGADFTVQLPLHTGADWM
jgi:signal transduction histidine kinase